jgi:release factor glutamine methyltransferase
MSATLSPASRSAVVASLRAAGCVFAEDEAELLIAAASTASDLARLVEQRVAGLPLEQILGWAEFCGIRMAIDPRVFVPRRRSEFVVECAAVVTTTDAIVVDMCCGSGAIGAALAAIQPVDLYAVDIDPTAVACARRNVTGHVYEGDLFDPLPATLHGRVDVLVVNAPYVPTDEIAFMPPEARLYEAQVALDGGADGLDIQRRVVAAAPLWLASTGTLLIETSDRQAASTAAMIAQAGLQPRVLRSDELDATVVMGIR